MSAENSAALFIRLLTEAYEADRRLHNSKASARNKAQADRFKHRQLEALHEFRAALEPLDCAQLMTSNIQSRDMR